MKMVLFPRGMGGSAGFERKFVPNSAREVQMPGSERENSLFYAR